MNEDKALILVMRKLPLRHVVLASQVSRQWRRCAEDRGVWEAWWSKIYERNDEIKSMLPFLLNSVRFSQPFAKSKQSFGLLWNYIFGEHRKTIGVLGDEANLHHLLQLCHSRVVHKATCLINVELACRTNGDSLRENVGVVGGVNNNPAFNRGGRTEGGVAAAFSSGAGAATATTTTTVVSSSNNSTSATTERSRSGAVSKNSSGNNDDDDEIFAVDDDDDFNQSHHTTNTNKAAATTTTTTSTAAAFSSSSSSAAAEIFSPIRAALAAAAAAAPAENQIPPPGFALFQVFYVVACEKGSHHPSGVRLLFTKDPEAMVQLVISRAISCIVALQNSHLVHECFRQLSMPLEQAPSPLLDVPIYLVPPSSWHGLADVEDEAWADILTDSERLESLQRAFGFTPRAAQPHSSSSSHHHSSSSSSSSSSRNSNNNSSSSSNVSSQNNNNSSSSSSAHQDGDPSFPSAFSSTSTDPVTARRIRTHLATSLVPSNPTLPAFFASKTFPNVSVWVGGNSPHSGCVLYRNRAYDRFEQAGNILSDFGWKKDFTNSSARLAAATAAERAISSSYEASSFGARGSYFPDFEEDDSNSPYGKRGSYSSPGAGVGGLEIADAKRKSFLALAWVTEVLFPHCYIESPPYPGGGGGGGGGGATASGGEDSSLLSTPNSKMTFGDRVKTVARSFVGGAPSPSSAAAAGGSSSSGNFPLPTTPGGGSAAAAAGGSGGAGGWENIVPATVSVENAGSHNEKIRVKAWLKVPHVMEKSSHPNDLVFGHYYIQVVVDFISSPPRLSISTQTRMKGPEFSRSVAKMTDLTRPDVTFEHKRKRFALDAPKVLRRELEVEPMALSLPSLSLEDRPSMHVIDLQQRQRAWSFAGMSTMRPGTVSGSASYGTRQAASSVGSSFMIASDAVIAPIREEVFFGSDFSRRDGGGMIVMGGFGDDDDHRNNNNNNNNNNGDNVGHVVVSGSSVSENLMFVGEDDSVGFVQEEPGPLLMQLESFHLSNPRYPTTSS